jgi:hypothetical protein
MRQRAQRDQAKAERQRHLHSPSGYGVDECPAGSAFGKHEVHAGHCQQSAHDRGHGSCDQVSRRTKSMRQSRFLYRKQSQQPVVASRNCASHHPHQKTQVLHDGRLAHDAGV